MTLTKALTQENQLNNEYENTLDFFWQQGEFKTFIGVDNADIQFAKFVQSANTKTIIISPGRGESYLKYKELCFDLYNQNYNIFIIDHRGQGLSTRLLSDNKKGYVKSFDDYVEDLNTLIEDHIKLKPYLLGHSMGSTIALLFMLKYPQKLTAAALCSPLININSGITPMWLAKAFIKLVNTYDKLCHFESDYFLGQRKYKLKTFAENKQSQSRKRYQRYVDLYTQQPALQIGGVTTHWLNEVLKTEKLLFKHINKLVTPVTIIQAGNEVIVDNNAQNKLCALIKQNTKSSAHSEPLVIEGAFHELLFEKDEYRNKTILHILQWFDQHS